MQRSELVLTGAFSQFALRATTPIRQMRVVRCCDSGAQKNGVPVSASHYAAPQLIIFRVRARFYFYLAQRVGGRCGENAFFLCLAAC